MRRLQRESTTRLRELTIAIDECLQLQCEDTASAEFRQQTDTLIAQLNALRDAQQWGELLNHTTSYRDFYQSEAECLRQHIADTRAAELRREHRLRQSSAQLADELRRLPASSERDELLEKLSASDIDLDAAMAAAVEVVGAATRRSEDAEATQRLRAAAAAFADTGSSESTLVAAAPRDAREVRLERCWALLGELEAISPAESIAAWKERATRVEAAAESERDLLLDSLAIDLTSYVRSKRAAEAARSAVTATLAELEMVSGAEAEAWCERLRSALSQTDSAQSLVEQARRWIEEEHAREDAQEQRGAVLRALAELGYEVREGMATAWAENGRVVVRKPHETAYGVEFSAPAAGGAFQVRVVADGAQQRNTQRDREVEEAWCGEFARLQSLLGKDGFETALAQAHAPGAIPIKVLPAQTSQATRDRMPERRGLSRSADE